MDLEQGVGRYYCEFTTDYKQIDFAQHPDEVQTIALTHGMPTVPYSVLIRGDEMWVCYDQAIRHPYVGYFEVRPQNGLH